jgi:predicted carbohydrate-binding protein with CBM5 and CBM33 domain
VKTPTLQPKPDPKVDPDRIVLIGEADEPRPNLLIVLGALALVAAMAVGGGIVYAWGQGQIHDRDQRVHDARVETQNAQNAADGAFASVTRLQSDVTDLQSTIEQQGKNQDIQQGQINDAQGRVAAAEARLADEQGRLRAVTGPKVSNTRHIAFLLAAGTEQSPPMIVIDLGRWYSGDAARQAAVADGALTTGEHLFHGRYLRNTEHDWRILPVTTGALFTIRHYNGATTPTSVSFTTMASILNGAGFDRIAHNPFWVQVEHHSIVSGHEQRYRAP